MALERPEVPLESIEGANGALFASIKTLRSGKWRRETDIDRDYRESLVGPTGQAAFVVVVVEPPKVAGSRRTKSSPEGPGRRPERHTT